MNIIIRLTKVEYEMLKELKKRDHKYRRGLESKAKRDLADAYKKDPN